jgi:hypothetical protein
MKVPTAVDVGFVVNTLVIRLVLFLLIRLSTLNYNPPNFNLSPGAGKVGPLAAALRIKGVSLTTIQEF